MNNVGMYFNSASTNDIENIIEIMRGGYHKCWDKKFFLNFTKFGVLMYFASTLLEMIDFDSQILPKLLSGIL